MPAAFISRISRSSSGLDRWAKPPPPHHDAAVVGRFLELPLKLFNSRAGKSWRLLRKRGERKAKQQDRPFCSPQDVRPRHFLVAPCFFFANHWATSASSVLRSGFFCAMTRDSWYSRLRSPKSTFEPTRTNNGIWCNSAFTVTVWPPW